LVLRMAFLSVHSSPLGLMGGKDTGGMSGYLLGLSAALGGLGHQVDLYTRAQDIGIGSVRSLSANVRLVTFDDKLGPLDKNEIYPHCESIARTILNFIEAEQVSYDLIFSHYWLSGCVGRYISAALNLSHHIMFHTLGRAKNEHCSAESEPNQRLAEEEALANEADLVVTAARLEKDRLLHYYGLCPEKVAIVPCGVDRNLFSPGDCKEARERLGLGEEKIILSVGRIEPVKGFDLLIDAAALLPGEDNFRVVIVGGDSSGRAGIAALKEKAAEAGLAGIVTFTGIVEHHLLPAYYRAADVTVIASSYESFGMVALESLSSGTPVVGGATGVMPELSGSPAVFSPVAVTAVTMVDSREPSAWAAAIRNACLHKNPLSADRENNLLAPYNWPGAANQYIRSLQTAE
jgi:D-inositol-3-phosphate glycosyltransferase